MRLKSETAVAVAILVACARCNDCRLKTVEAAKAANTSADFAAHIALKLVKAGFLKAKRGRGGELTLAHTADTIFLGDLIAGLEAQGSAEPQEIVESTSMEDEASDLGQIITGANFAMRTFLNRFSIADLPNCRATSSSAKMRMQKCR
jgi:Rrf2 family protein